MKHQNNECNKHLQRKCIEKGKLRCLTQTFSSLFLKYAWYQQKRNELFTVNPHKQSYLHLGMVGEDKLWQAAECT